MQKIKGHCSQASVLSYLKFWKPNFLLEWSGIATVTTLYEVVRACFLSSIFTFQNRKPFQNLVRSLGLLLSKRSISPQDIFEDIQRDPLGFGIFHHFECILRRMGFDGCRFQSRSHLMLPDIVPTLKITVSIFS